VLTSDDWLALGLSLRLACLTTALLVIMAVPMAWGLARWRSRWGAVVRGLIALPLVLPPTVLGFYLLVLTGPQGVVGQLTQYLGLGVLPFSFAGLVLASVLYSLPFMVQPVLASFEALDPGLLEAAATLGANRASQFRRVALPLALPGILGGCTLAFAHTLGEFGVILMMGGNIPGRTQVVSVQIYQYTETAQWAAAHHVSLVLLALCLGLLWITQLTRPAPGTTGRPW
jgi:molybdate transport system permease protein